MLNGLLRHAMLCALFIGAGALQGCGSAGAQNDGGQVVMAMCPDGSKVKGSPKNCPSPGSGAPTTTTTTPATPPATDTPSPGLGGEADIPDNFDANVGLEPVAIPAASADPDGAFRFGCLPGQLLYDDPIAYPGQPGKSHLHQFIGNVAANASTTYHDLRTKGGSTCDNRGQPYAFNRSSYWMPAMLDGEGSVVKPDQVLVYYKRLPASDPRCGAPDATHIGYCIAIPNGIKFIFGYNMATMSGGPADMNSWDRWTMNWTCVSRPLGSDLTGKKYATLADAVAVCPVGQWIKASLDGPQCWDGKNLDSADHRSHMAYVNRPTSPGIGYGCPLDHPYLIPTVGYQWFFTVNDHAEKWRLSSDDMMAQMGHPVVPGATLHMDYFEGWSPTIKAAWDTHCLDGHLTCSNGDLGNGQREKAAGVPIGGWIVQPLVPVPPRP